MEHVIFVIIILDCPIYSCINPSHEQSVLNETQKNANKGKDCFVVSKMALSSD